MVYPYNYNKKVIYMRRQKLMIVILFLILICSYFLRSSANHKVVCSLIEEKSSIEITANYNDEEIVKTLEVKFAQKFPKKSVSNMSEDEIVETLKTIFSQNRNENVQVQVTYNKEKRIGDVYLNIDMDNLSEIELKDYNLASKMKIDEFIEKIEAREFECEVIE